MSDMLQLVAKITSIKCNLPVTPKPTVGNLGDKLKHVGHLVEDWLEAPNPLWLGGTLAGCNFLPQKREAFF